MTVIDCRVRVVDNVQGRYWPSRISVRTNLVPP